MADDRVPQTSGGDEPPTTLRPYRPPSLEPWGAITELTRGKKAAGQDFPNVGGTGGV